MWDLAIMTFVLAVAVFDWRWRRIPRELTVSGFVVGLIYHALAGGFLSALSATGLGFGVGLALFELRAIGGGDVKLLTALGALLGLRSWVFAVEIALFAAGAMAVIGLVRRGILLQAVRNIGRLVVHFVRHGFVPHPEIHVNNPSLVRVPFGVAAALGTVCTLLKVG